MRFLVLRLFVAFLFSLSFGLVFAKDSLAGYTINLYGRPTSSSGVVGWSTTGYCWSSDGRDSSGCYVPPSPAHIKIYGCTSDQGYPYTCDGSNGASMIGYYGANGYLLGIWNYTGLGYCKIQMDVFGSGNYPIDWLVWKDPSRCSQPPPSPAKYRCSNYTCIRDDAGGNTTDPSCGGCGSPPPTSYYNAVSPVGGVTISSLYPTFVWTTNNSPCSGCYNNINIHTNPRCADQDVIFGFGPSVDARSYTSTRQFNPGTTYYWLIYGRYPDGHFTGTSCQAFTTPSNGTLNVYTTPISGGVYVDGGYWGNATQSRSLAPGTHIITFGGVANYVTPGSQSVGLNSNQTSSVTGTYTIQSGTLTVNTTPVSGGVLVNGVSWGAAPQSRVLSPGTYTVSFGAVTNYNTPANQSLAVNSNQTTNVTGTYTVRAGTLTVNTTPVAGGIFVNGSGWGTAPQSRSLSPGTYTVSFGAVTNYNTPGNQSITVNSNQTSTVTGTYTAQNGTVGGTVFQDSNKNGLIDGGEAGSNQTTLSLVQPGGAATQGTVGGSGGFSFANVVPGQYRLEIGPNFGYESTRWNVTGAAYGYGSSGGRFFTRQLTNDYPFNVTIGSNADVKLGINQLPSSGLIIELYHDIQLDGLTPGDQLLSTSVQFDCSPTAVGSPCQSGMNMITGQLTLSNLPNGTYTLIYKPQASSYDTVTDIRVDPGNVDCTAGAPIPKPPNCNVNLNANATVKYAVTNNSLPWIQVWDGDVAANFNSNASQPGLKITVPNNPLAPYRAVFIQNNLGVNGGGLALTVAGSASPSCNGQACSERGWILSNYATTIPWPLSIDNLSANGLNVFYFPSSLTISAVNKNDFRSGGQYYRGIVVVNGDLTIQANQVASGNVSGDLNAFLVAKGKIIIQGNATANELIVSGGLLAKNGFGITYSLTNNRRPLLVTKYDPSILILNTSLSEPIYTWREVAP